MSFSDETIMQVRKRLDDSGFLTAGECHFLLHVIDELKREIGEMRKKLESDRRYREQLSEAFNSGDGSYHP